VVVAAREAASRFPAAVERFYTHGLYPGIVAALGWLTGRVPVSIGEGLLLLVAVIVLGLSAQLVLVLRHARGRRTRVLGLALLRTAAAAAVLYAAFLVLWGLNYARLPLAAQAGLDVHPAPLTELVELSQELVGEADRLREGLPEDAAGVLSAPGGLRSILERAPAGLRRAAERQRGLMIPVAPPKAALFSPLMSYLGITGIYFPFTAEAHVNHTVPVPELPFVASHELAHQTGVAREDEANYVAYLACRAHPDGDFRYSGAFSASLYALGALARLDRAAWRGLEGRRSAGVRRDLKALSAWSARYEGRAERASRTLNDAYLRSQGQVQGVASYGRMLDLLLAERRRSGAP
jgi:uncharacterized protein DUF3810